jgi:hypothetical protein
VKRTLFASTLLVAFALVGAPARTEDGIKQLAHAPPDCTAKPVGDGIDVICDFKCESRWHATLLYAALEPKGDVVTGHDSVHVPFRKGDVRVIEVACEQDVHVGTVVQRGLAYPHKVISVTWLESPGPLVSVANVTHPEDEAILQRQVEAAGPAPNQYPGGQYGR